MIGMIEADNSYDTVYGVGYFGLRRLTGVDYCKAPRRSVVAALVGGEQEPVS